MKLLIALWALAFVLVNAQVHSKPKFVAMPVLDTPEDLTDEQKESMSAHAVDWMPTGTDRVPAGAGLAPPINTQIIGGSTATRGQFPWQAAVEQDNSWFCGGSLIGSRWILTAAHCAFGINTFVITLGAQNLGVSESGRVVQTTTTKVVHSGYNENTLNNDIALVKLTTAVTTPTNFINIIRLPKTSNAGLSLSGTVATVSGWGKTSDGGSVEDLLRYVSVPVITNAVCAATFGSTTVVSSTLCTSGANLKSTCNGDSGGPLVYKEADGLWTQIGIVSFGTQSCTQGYPSAFARVSSFLGWISSNTGIAIRP